MTIEQLNDVLESHVRWLESEGQQGKRADLRMADLRSARLERADLRRADLTGAHLQGADLSMADLSGAQLKGADLQRANLKCAHLEKTEGLSTACLRDVDLREVTGLKGGELAGADLTGARLSEPLADFGRLEYVRQVAQLARPMFLLLMVTGAFMLLTLVWTEDVAIVTNAPSAVLPNFSTPIPAAAFFWVAPFALLILYGYLHLYLESIWREFAKLPAVFPDGTPVELRAGPWLVFDLSKLGRGHPSRPVRLRVAAFMVWWALPVGFLAAWWRYLFMHSWPVTGLHVILVVGSLWAAEVLRLRTRAALRREQAGFPGPLRRIWMVATLLVAVSAFVFINPFIYVIEKPKRLTAIVADLEEADMTGGALRKKSLRFAYAHSARLDEADLRDADLYRSDFQRASFRRANMEKANLERANLDLADFGSACLRRADLSHADMDDADFRGAYLGRARLDYAILNRARFQFANLQGASLANADLSDAYFEGAVFHCYESHRKEKDRRRVDCADLSGAVLRSAQMQGVDLRYARLQGADLTGAVLDGARLDHVDLRGAEGLTQDQLDRACGSPETRLPPGLQVENCSEEEISRSRLKQQKRPDPEKNPCYHEIQGDRLRPMIRATKDKASQEPARE